MEREQEQRRFLDGLREDPEGAQQQP
jgi:hypothetical protein